MDRFAEYRGRRAGWYGGMDSVLVELGVDGLGSGAPVGLAVTQGGGAVAALLTEHLLPLTLGRRLEAVADIELLAEQLRLATHPYGSAGIAAMARSAIDIALWDLLGRLRSEPVYRMLGGDPSPMPVYATGNDIEHHRDLGFTASKVGLQYGPWHENGRARASDQIIGARARAGADHTLMADGWMGLDVPFVRSVSAALREAAFEWLEEPLPPDDQSGLALVAEVLGDVALATGEHATTHAELLLTARSGARVLQPDIAWCGGITAIRRLAAQLPPGVELTPHLSGTPWGLHVAAALPLVRRVEWYVESEPGEPLEAVQGPLTGGPLPSAGMISPREEPGLGIGVHAEFIDRWAGRAHTINAR
ncbi:L-rhamnonate dehydratase [Microbacterium soli]|uniref:L-rhamnonate dehydratase n=2 Tax=Microbacterium soli TaxID=446075 RepID=A0ABP7N6M2_9MICO